MQTPAAPFRIRHLAGDGEIRRLRAALETLQGVQKGGDAAGQLSEEAVRWIADADAWAIEELGTPNSQGSRSGFVDGEAVRGSRDPAELALARGAVHEWFSGAESADGGAIPRGQRWIPAMQLLMRVVARADGADGGRASSDAGLRGGVLWIGRRCWPAMNALAQVGRGTGDEEARRAGSGPAVDRSLRARSIFVDARTLAERVWAMDLGLRCPGVACVVADASGVKMAQSRRLQLAAEAGFQAGGGGLGLFARPWWEAKEISAARTRWRVTPAPSPTANPRWSVELLRRKGMRPASEAARAFLVQRNHATGALVVVPQVVDGSAPQALPRQRTA